MTQPNPPAGTIVHHEFVSADPSATKAFFSKVFGWKFSDWDPSYSLFEGPGGSAGGVRAPEAGETPGTIHYVIVDNLDRAVKDIAAAGAHVLNARIDIPNMGAMAVYVAPGGIVQGVWEPAAPQ